MSEKMITDFAGNTYPESALNDQETPNWDPHGARKDRAMQALPDIIAKARAEQPNVGDRAVVTGGRKHRGKEGEVIWRGVDKFAKTSRYGDSLGNAVARSLGFYDRVGVRTDDGAKFFVPLSYCAKK